MGETLAFNLNEKFFNWLSEKVEEREVFIALKGVLLAYVDGDLRIATEDYKAENEDTIVYTLMFSRVQVKAPQKRSSRSTKKRVRLLNQQNTQQKVVNWHHQNAMLKQAKFWIDQVKFFMKRQCEHLYCEDAVWYEDCNKPFEEIINSVYNKVYQES